MGEKCLIVQNVTRRIDGAVLLTTLPQRDTVRNAVITEANKQLINEGVWVGRRGARCPPYTTDGRAGERGRKKGEKKKGREKMGREKGEEGSESREDGEGYTISSQMSLKAQVS